MNIFIIEVAAAVVSGLLLAAIAALWGGRAPKKDSEGHIAIVDGDGNTVVQKGPETQITLVRTRVTQFHEHRSGSDGSASDDDPIGYGIAFLVALVAVTLAYLVAKPILVPLVFGASAAVAGLTASMWRLTPPGAGPRGLVTTFGVGQAVVAGVVLWLRAHPLRGEGMAAVEARLAESVDGYDDGLVARARAIWNTPETVLATLGQEGFGTTLVDLLSVITCGALVVWSLLHLVNWRAFVRVGNGASTAEKDLLRAGSYLDTSAVETVLLLVGAGVVAAFLASGIFLQWFMGTAQL